MKTKHYIRSVISVLTSAFCLVTAHAQDLQTGRPATVAASPLTQDVAEATSVRGLDDSDGTPSGQTPQFSARPVDKELLPFAAILHGVGIDFHALFIDTFLANPSTGVNTGRSGNSGVVILGGDLDFGKIFGLHGGTLHFDESFFLLRHNTGVPYSFTSDVGSYLGGNGFPNNTPENNHLSLLTYEQRLLDGRLQLEGGRTNAFRYFELQNCSNIATCVDPIAQFTAGIAPPPFATWGARARYAFDDKQFAQVGVFEDNFSKVFTNGWNWGTHDAKGALIMGEYGSRSSFANERLPLSYELIGFYRTSRQTDPAVSALGRSAVFFPTDPPSQRHGTGGAIFRWQKFVWRADGEGSADPAPRSLAVFGTLSGTPDPMQPYRVFGESGVTWFAPFNNRPFDRVNFKVSYVRVSQSQLDFQHDARLAAGGPDRYTSPNQFRLQLDGHFALAKAIAIEPMVQYILNPDTFYNPYSSSVPKHGFVVGFTLIASLGDLLRISSPPGH